MEDMKTGDDAASFSTPPGSTYEVFLSFRGADIRRTFADHLYVRLRDAGFRTFRDNGELRVGEEIGPDLMKAIEESSISIPIFSEGYASSKWCLQELTHMVRRMNDKDPEGRQRHTVCPIFYDVTPGDVKHQTGSFAEAFKKHTNYKEVNASTIQEWKDALREVGQLKGWEKDKIAFGHEAEVVEKVVADVRRMLDEKNAAQIRRSEIYEASVPSDEDTELDEATIHTEFEKVEREFKLTSPGFRPAIVSRFRKVPRLLLDTVHGESKYFRPKVLFLGPCHREQQENYEESKQLKQKAAKMFINAKTWADVHAWEEAYKKIRRRVNRFMEFYALEPKESQKSGEENARMLFLDGCAAMYFITGANNVDKSGIKNHELVLAEQDLFKLENQLPFEVLELLMVQKFPNLKEGKSYMEDFIEAHIPTKNIANVAGKDKNGPFLTIHILHLMRTRLLEQEVRRSPDLPKGKSFKEDRIENVAGKDKNRPVHLLHLMRTRLQEATSSNQNQNSSTTRVDTSLPYSCRSAVQLHKRGISFKACQSSREGKVHFRDRLLSGVLYLPSIVIDDLSKGKLLNLVADEMSSDVPNSSEIASYLCFLDSLIDDAEDVKILREANIIRNGLGSDQELANLFNEITENLVPDNEIYKGVMAAIQSHFDNKTKTWMARLYEDYFGTPWALIAFSGAILLLSLTLIQTYLSLVPPASEERSQWKRLWHILKHMYMPIVLALPMACLLLIILLVFLVGIYMYGFPSKYKPRN